MFFFEKKLVWVRFGLFQKDFKKMMSEKIDDVRVYLKFQTYLVFFLVLIIPSRPIVSVRHTMVSFQVGHMKKKNSIRLTSLRLRQNALNAFPNIKA